MNAQARSRLQESVAGESGAAGRAVPRLRVATSAARSGSSAPARTRPKRRWITLPRLFLLVTVALLAWGYSFPTEQYLTPQSGVGYALGIVGGSSMLLLLVYPLRKRVRALTFIGTTKHWFQAHMALGVIGPVLILFHSNFSLGATNSNVALACMLVVSGSGLFGRYFYTRIHHGLHGRKASLAELRDYAEKLRWVTTAVDFLPDLVSRLEREEQGIVALCEARLVLLRPLVGFVGVFIARRRLHHYVAQQLRGLRGGAGDSRDRRRQLRRTAGAYIDDRLAATRRVVEFAAFERLFSLWHALHLPLFVMLLVAGIAHVIAVHVY
jgi:hypothetical protein